MNKISSQLVSIIIVTKGSKDYIWQLLDSLQKQTYSLIEVIVIDNSLNPDFAKKIIQFFPAAKLYSSPENLFYCQALNKGIEMSKGEFILCLNDDVVLERSFISEALKGFSVDARVGMVSGKILRDDGKTIDSTGLFLSPLRSAKERGYSKKDRGQFEKEGYIFGVNGAVAFYRKTMLEQIKINSEYFDSDFRFYYEDLDIAWRSQNFGWKCYYIPKAIAYHARGATARPKNGLNRKFARRYISDELLIDLVKNRYLTIIKNENLPNFLLHLPLVIFYDLFAWGYLLLFRTSLLSKIFKKAILIKPAFQKRRLLLNCQKRTNQLFVITKLELGGAQKQLLSLINNLNRAKHKIYLFTAGEGLLFDEAKSINGLKIKSSKFLERPINPLKDCLALFEIYVFIKKNKIDIVHTHSSKAGILGRIAARLANVRAIIHTVHGWSFNDWQPNFLQYFYIWLERLAARFTDKLIVVSQFDKQKGLNNAIGKEDKYCVIPYGIDYGQFNQAYPSAKAELGINSKDLVVGTISCLKPQKAPEDFIKLANLIKGSLPNVKFILIGDGVLRKSIEKLIGEFNLQKQFILTGWRRDIPRILSTIDVLVLTSLWEGLPISVLEAMAKAIPVVATNTGGIAEIICDGNTGFLVPAKDIRKMSEKVISLLKDESLRRQIGQNARVFLGDNFSLQNMTEHTQRLYADLCQAGAQ